LTCEENLESIEGVPVDISVDVSNIRKWYEFDVPSSK